MRHEFPAAVKREALARAGGQCEAIGERYGKPAGERCDRSIGKGKVQFDHYPRGAHDPSPETVTLGNCTACCPECNQYAANHTDKAAEAKIKRIRRKHGFEPDNRKPRPKMRSRGFSQGKRSIPSRPFPQRSK